MYGSSSRQQSDSETWRSTYPVTDHIGQRERHVRMAERRGHCTNQSNTVNKCVQKKYYNPTLSNASDVFCVYRLFRHMLVFVLVYHPFALRVGRKEKKCLPYHTKKKKVIKCTSHGEDGWFDHGEWESRWEYDKISTSAIAIQNREVLCSFPLTSEEKVLAQIGMNGIKKGFSTVNYSSDSSSSVFIILQDWFSDAKWVERNESILNDDLPFS